MVRLLPSFKKTLKSEARQPKASSEDKILLIPFWYQVAKRGAIDELLSVGIVARSNRVRCIILIAGY